MLKKGGAQSRGRRQRPRTGKCSFIWRSRRRRRAAAVTARPSGAGPGQRRAPRSPCPRPSSPPAPRPGTEGRLSPGAAAGPRAGGGDGPAPRILRALSAGGGSRQPPPPTPPPPADPPPSWMLRSRCRRRGRPPAGIAPAEAARVGGSEAAAAGSESAEGASWAAGQPPPRALRGCGSSFSSLLGPD